MSTKPETFLKRIEQDIDKSERFSKQLTTDDEQITKQIAMKDKQIDRDKNLLNNNKTVKRISDTITEISQMLRDCADDLQAGTSTDE